MGDGKKCLRFRKREDCGSDKIFEERIAENFQNLTKYYTNTVELKIPKRINMDKTICRYIIMELLKIKTKSKSKGT